MGGASASSISSMDKPPPQAGHLGELPLRFRSSEEQAEHRPKQPNPPEADSPKKRKKQDGGEHEKQEPVKLEGQAEYLPKHPNPPEADPPKNTKKQNREEQEKQEPVKLQSRSEEKPEGKPEEKTEWWPDFLREHGFTPENTGLFPPEGWEEALKKVEASNYGQVDDPVPLEHVFSEAIETVYKPLRNLRSQKRNISLRDG